MTLEQAQRRIEDLEEEVRLFKAALGLGFRFPSIFQFSRREQILLGVLTTRRIMTYDMAILALYGDCVDGGPLSVRNVIAVSMVKLRKKLKRFDVTITGLYNIGYEIDEKSRKLLREIMVKE